jgi:hypothetical protein
MNRGSQMVERSPYVLAVALSFTGLVANACGGESTVSREYGRGGEAAVPGGGNVSSGGKVSDGGTLTGGNHDGGATARGGAGFGGGERAGAGQGGSSATGNGAGGAGGGRLVGGTGAGANRGGTGAESAGAADSGGEAGEVTNHAGRGGTTSATGGTSGSSAGRGGGASGSSGQSSLGGPCEDDGDCPDDVVCLAPDARYNGGAAPPHGLCTLVCETDDDCWHTATGRGHCVALDPDGTQFYCVEDCTPGPEGVPKCHSRSDLACSLVSLNEKQGTTQACATSADCGPGQLCDSVVGRCGDIITGCLPACGGDFDCELGQYCDFRTGMCMTGQATGLPIGSACDPTAMPDACNGFCVSSGDGSGTIGSCAGFCSFSAGLTGCGWNGTGPAQAGCVLGTLLSPNGEATGDVGVCGALCDCNDDCGVATERCVDDSGAAVKDTFGRAGYCRPLLASETEADTIACH